MHPFPFRAPVEAAIRKRGTQPFAAHEIAAEVGCCRPTVYNVIRRLREEGHRIEGEPRMGFMARMRDEQEAA